MKTMKSTDAPTSQAKRERDEQTESYDILHPLIQGSVPLERSRHVHPTREGAITGPERATEQQIKICGSISGDDRSRHRRSVVAPL